MNRRDFLIATACTLAVALLAEIVPQGGVTLLAGAVVVAIINIAGRMKLPHAYRLFSVSFIYLVGIALALVGVTMETIRTREGVMTSAMLLLIFVAAPAATFLAVWPGQRGRRLTMLFFPVCLAAACGIAELEEWVFMNLNPTGADITARWTVSNHWFAYEPGGRGLYGSD